MKKQGRNHPKTEDEKPELNLIIDQAVKAHRSGSIEQARKLYEKVLEVNPEHPDALYLLGGIYYQKNRPTTAVDFISRAIQSKPERDYFYSSLALALSALGKGEDSMAAFHTALALKPGNPETYHLMGKALNRSKKLDEAESAFRKAVELDEKFTEAYRSLGSLLMKKGEPERAGEVYQAALKHNPDSVEIWNRLGKAYFAAGKLEEAAKTLNDTLQFAPEDSRTYQNLGAVYEAAGKKNEAAKAFQASIEHSSDRSGAYLNFGNYLLARKRGREAIESFQRAIKIKPDFGAAHNSLGIALKGEGRLEEAIAAYQKAIEFDPDYPETFNNLGVALSSAGRTKEAEDAFRKSIDLNHSNPHVFQNLGIALKALGKTEQASAAFQRAVALKPDFADAFHNLGSALIDLDRPDQALIALKRAAELDPDNHSAKYMVSALSGENPESAPPEYVRELFDQYSKRFDEHLTGKLDYKTPRILREALEIAAGRGKTFSKLLDLGCGAGLAGEVFRDVARRLDGVDISGEMIRMAAAKRVYERLETSEIVEFLDHCEEKFDLAVAADVFVYIGDLEPIFCRIRKLIEKGGFFVFSTEKLNGEGYKLGPSGRFMHSEDYIRAVSGINDFECEYSVRATLRREGGKEVIGHCFVLKRR